MSTATTTPSYCIGGFCAVQTFIYLTHSGFFYIWQSILIITHDLGVVAEIAQRVLVMYAGEIVESGPAKAVLNNPFHPYTKGLIASIPKLGTKKQPGVRLEEISGNVPSLDQRPSGCPFHPRCSWAMEICKTQNPQNFACCAFSSSDYFFFNDATIFSVYKKMKSN